MFAPTLKYSATILDELVECGKPFEHNITGFMNALASKKINLHRPESVDLQHEFDNFFLTRPKKSIVEGVQQFCGDLVRNEFIFKSGNSSRLIVGERGIGKSTTLLNTTRAIYACHPNVLPIYIEYIGDDSSFKSPSQILSNALQIPNSTIMECLNILKERNQYAFVFVDELDQLYTSTNNSSMRLKILQELGEMGSQRSGRLYSILCGSSSALPMLISKNAVYKPALVAEFPLVGNAPNLNGSKYSLFRVDRGSIQDIAADYETITEHYLLPRNCGHLLYFFVGSNLRSADNLVNALRVRSDTWASRCLEICSPPKLWDNRASKTLKENKELMLALSDSLVKKNYSLLKNLHANLDSIATIPFLDEFKTLSHEEVRVAAKSANVPDYSLILQSLVDKGYFSGSSTLLDVGPGRPLDLLYYFPIYEHKLSLRNSATTDSLNTGLVETGKEARKQLIQEAVRVGLQGLKALFVTVAN